MLISFLSFSDYSRLEDRGHVSTVEVVLRSGDLKGAFYRRPRCSLLISLSLTLNFGWLIPVVVSQIV